MTAALRRRARRRSPTTRCAGERPKIVYTTADASPQSGAFHSLVSMSKEIVEWGYQPVLVLPEEARSALRADIADVPVYILPLARPRRSPSPGQFVRYVLQGARSIYELGGIIRREGAALVHVNEILDVYGAMAARIAGIPCVCHLRADLSAAPSLLQTLLPRTMAALSSHIVAVSASACEHTFGRSAVESHKISVVHNPAPNPSAFHLHVDGTLVRKEFGLTDDTFLIALVAKLGQRKGHEVLIRAAAQVLASFPTTRFLLVGGELDGPYHRAYADRLTRLPSQLGIHHAVRFTGYRTDIPQIMAAADVVTHCSTYPDPFPGVVLQSMAIGTAVIASDLGGPREQIEDQVSGVLVPAGDPSALAHAICSLLEDPAKRASLGRAGALRLRSAFTSDSFYRQISEIYRPLIASRAESLGVAS